MPLGDPMGYNQTIGPLNESTFVDTPDTPLAFRMMEHLPGFAATVGFGANRGANTMMYGGFMDDLSDPQAILSKRRQRRLERRATKHRIMMGGQLSAAQDSHFVGSAKRTQAARAAGKTPFLRSSRVNNATLNPRALFRAHSQSVFAAESAGAYSMFGSYRALNNKFGNRLGSKIVGGDIATGQTAFGPGLLSAITAGRRTDVLERRAMSGSSRAAAKLKKIDNATASMLRMNTPKGLAVSGGEFGRIIPKSMNMGIIAPAGQTATQTAVGLGGYSTVTGTGTLGVRGNIQASALTGVATGTLAGYSRGALGFGKFTGYAGLTGSALDGARLAEKQFVTAFGRAGLGTRSMAYEALQPGNLLKTLRATEGGVLRGISGIAAKGGAKALAMRGAAMAIPGLNVLAFASLAYDLGKMGGELVKSGINFVRDANKSLQGSIAKPTFGMGYRDTEAAATSRARGVMAIQNSRLNARSMLGAEGAMMAAHYG